jgi:pimeloyl-ACP methyl ester carboxylesterase
MSLRDEPVDIAVDGCTIGGTVVAGADGGSQPGALFVHGWGGSQEQYLSRARAVAETGCVCLTFDLRGHQRTLTQHEAVTREQNLHDVVAAYDVLASREGVDGSRIALVGSSYGAYLGALATVLRPVRWLSLRAPAIYKDAGWNLPKRTLHRDPEFADFRLREHRPSDNRALDACARFRGDALVVESGDDRIVPHAVVASYNAALATAHSLTYRVIEDADHGLTQERWKQAYSDLLVAWLNEMMADASGPPPAGPAASQARLPAET